MIILLLGLTQLQSCQSNTAARTEKLSQQKRKAETVSYNLQLGLGYLEQGNTSRAKKKLLYALDLEPTSTEANGAMAYYLEKTGDSEGAKKYYLRALVLAPGNGAVLNNYGTFLCRHKQYEEAISYFLKATQDAHYLHSAGAYENAGLCAEAIPNNTKAEFYFEKALEQDPLRKQSLYELTTLLLKQNKSQQALQYLQQYQDIALNDPALLKVAMDVAQQTGKDDLEKNYKLRLGQLNNLTEYSGENDEYDRSRG